MSKTVLIIGASRGIGFEFATQYAANGWQVFASGRDEAALARLQALGCHTFMLDVTDPVAVSNFGKKLSAEKMDVAIVNAGVAGERTAAMQAPTQQEFDWVMRTNVWGPMQVIAQLPPLLNKGSKLAVLSSRMGSIGSRASNAWWLYRASKAALNSVLKDASIALSGTTTCVALHPGWVRTEMGGANADLSVQESVNNMRHTLLSVTPGQNGSYLNYDGEEIPW
ncbi:MAG: SDR family oxidoreductase [Burkholderiaceae bacterium]|nr:SDR family oxidoreductase [Burkholderiaceae bacterium]